MPTNYNLSATAADRRAVPSKFQAALLPFVLVFLRFPGSFCFFSCCFFLFLLSHSWLGLDRCVYRVVQKCGRFCYTLGSLSRRSHRVAVRFAACVRSWPSPVFSLVVFQSFGFVESFGRLSMHQMCRLIGQTAERSVFMMHSGVWPSLSY